MTQAPASPKSLWQRLVPLGVVGGLIVGFFASGFGEVFTLESLKENRAVLQGFVAERWVLAAGFYMVLYAVCTALSLPVAAVLTVCGGLLFGSITGTALTVVGATLGACVIFLIARYALGDVFRGRAGGAIAAMQKGFSENAFSYLLMLRLVPLFPFFVVNIAPAFLAVSLRTFFVATLIGIVPGTFVYVQLGAGLDSLIEQGGALTLEGVLTWDVVLALVGLGLLALVPVGYKGFFGKG